MYKYWRNNLIGTEPTNDGKSRIEIDESSFITTNNTTTWLFGLVDRATYEIRIFYVDNNRSRETLLPIVRNNVYTYFNSIENN